MPLDCREHEEFCSHVDRLATAVIAAGHRAIEDGEWIPATLHNPTREEVLELRALLLKEGWELVVPALGVGEDPRPESIRLLAFGVRPGRQAVAA